LQIENVVFLGLPSRGDEMSSIPGVREPEPGAYRSWSHARLRNEMSVLRDQLLSKQLLSRRSCAAPSFVDDVPGT
jgi:hypothetical protein